MSVSKQRDIRRLAFQALFQLDARGDVQPQELQAALEAVASETAPQLTARDIDRAIALATAAYQRRRESDAAVAELAPGWPAQRQPAADRAILRLAYHEMVGGSVSPKVAVNEAVELAKKFSTERSPAFVNGVLDKVLRRLQVPGAEAAADATPPTPDTPASAAGEGVQSA